ncbi:MAG TPA: baseplate J/gp47 family protein [Candidatus Tumulicola sp.]
MPLPSPNLDDRTFDQLVADAVALIKAGGGPWREPAVGDPGMVLLDAFAYIAEQLLFRLNRVPEKAYVEFLNLIGATLYPPSAAIATVAFSMQKASAVKVVVPRGTRIGVPRSAAATAEVTFATVDDVAIEAGQTAVTARAINADRIEDELVGVGTGDGGQTFAVTRAPIIGATGTSFDLLVGVELADAPGIDRTSARVVDGVAYEIWREVDSFADAEPDAAVYVCDRVPGTIGFAPRLRRSDGATLNEAPTFLCRVPAPGKRILVSYATGGGPGGNVAAGSLSSLKDQVAGAALQVTNPAAATGGRSTETLENALLRGPREFHALQRAVTARDYELIATAHPAVSRARAYPKHELWNYAAPGTVALLLVPEYLEPADRANGTVTAEGLESVQTEETRTSISQTIDRRRPLGIVCAVDWVRYKTVKVQATVVVARGENAPAVQGRIVRKLHALVNPLPTLETRGWRFGRPLHVSDVTSLILAEPGVVYYRDVTLVVDDAPSTNVRALSADPTAPGRWYATSNAGLYRSLDDGGSWESVAAFPGERVVKVALTNEAPGLTAVASQSPADGDPTASIVRVSENAGESWGVPAVLVGVTVADLVLVRRDDGFVVLLATDKGLYELALKPGATPVQIPVFDGDAKFGFFSIGVTRVGGTVVVALAAQAQKGIWLSNQAGLGRSFEPWWNPPNADAISVLRVQRDGTRAFLWAGFGASGDETGKGAARIEIIGAPKNASSQNWDSFDGWSGQGVRELAFSDTTVFAASLSRGVVRLNFRAATPTWTPLSLGAGLPERSQAPTGDAPIQKLFELVTTIAASNDVVFTGGAGGVFKSVDSGDTYVPASATGFKDVVPLPPMWLFCSGPHEIQVTEDQRGS